MAINKNDFEMAKWVLDQAIYQNSALELRDAMLIRAFLSAIEEHEERPAENVRSREWRAMVYRKLLEDPAALHQFTEEALRKYTPGELASFLHPSIHQAVRDRYPGQSEESFDEVLSNTPGEELFEILKDKGRISDIIDYVLDQDPDYVKDYFGLDEEAFARGFESGTQEGYDQGHSEGHTEGHSEGFTEGLEEGLAD